MESGNPPHGSERKGLGIQRVQASFGSEKKPIQRQIEATDRKIDELVYELYGITEEERRVVEGTA